MITINFAQGRRRKEEGERKKEEEKPNHHLLLTTYYSQISLFANRLSSSQLNPAFLRA
jgi:hypothetical protein